jgi:hypothetical protein
MDGEKQGQRQAGRQDLETAALGEASQLGRSMIISVRDGPRPISPSPGPAPASRSRNGPMRSPSWAVCQNRWSRFTV